MNKGIEKTMDIVTAKLGANMAVDSLTAGGRVGSVKEQTFFVYEFVVPAGSRKHIDWVGLPKDKLIHLTVGKTYNIYINGVKHEGVARQSDYFAWYVGNASLLGSRPDHPNTGESFVMGCVNTIDGVFQVYLESEVSVDTPCYFELAEETVQPIDPKYFPEGSVGYIGSNLTKLLPKQSVVCEEIEGQPIAFLPYCGILVNGETYTVELDGVKYETTCRGSSLTNTEFTPDTNATGEPFMVMPVEHPTLGLVTVVSLGDANEHTIAIYQGGKIIRPIDQKFIPAMDSLTLNGADGKQYKLTVDENGQLTTTEVG